MPDEGTLARVDEQDNPASNGRHQSGGVWELLARWGGFSVARNRRQELQPPQPSSSKPGRTHHEHQPPQRPNEGNSTTFDMSREPDEDMLFLASPRRPGLTTSASFGSNSESGFRRRRDPMYNEGSQQRQSARRKRQLALHGGIDVALHKNSSSLHPNSSISGDTSTNTLPSPTSYSRVSSSQYPHAEPDNRSGVSYSPVYNTSHLGLDKFKALTGGDYFGLPISSARRAKVTNRDKLVQRRLPPQQHVDHFNNTLEVAKTALGSPKPSSTGSQVFRRTQLRDSDTSERINDLTRRRRIWPKDMPLENEQIIKAVLKTPGVISTLPAAEVAQKDIVKLLPGEWLNDEVINFYGVMVNRRSAEAKARRDKKLAEPGDENLLDVHVFTSFFFQKFVNAGYAGVRKWTKKFDLFKKDIIIMPVNLGNAHWVCAAINIEKQRFEYYDSMGKINLQVLNKLREYVKAEHLEKKKTRIDLDDWEDYHNPKTPQQANGYDCGVFTSQFIECLSRRDGHFDFDQKNMPYLRKKMIHEIKMMEFSAEQWSNPNA